MQCVNFNWVLMFLFFLQKTTQSIEMIGKNPGVDNIW